jgi:hypothetical protein
MDSNYMNTDLDASSRVIATETTTVSHRGIAWGAVAAGVIVAILLQIAFNLLGLSIGANTINPIQERNPVEPGFGSAAVLWLAGSMIVSLFAGGWVAAHLSGTADRVNGLLHGIVMWATGALITIILVTTGAGNLISGAAGAVGQGVSLLGQGALAAVPAVADSVNLQGLTSEAIANEVRGLTAAQRERAAAEANGTTADGAATEDSAVAAFDSLEDIEFNTLVTRFLTGEQEDAALREQVVALLGERAGLTTDEANAQLDRWTSAFNTVRDDAEATAREVGQQLTDTLAVVAGALFVSLLLGAFAAGGGGWVGAHEALTVKRTTAVR